MSNTRLAIVVSHPIPYFCAQYHSWASIAGVELRVFFASSHGVNEYFDDQFGQMVKWDRVALTFPHEFAIGAEGRAITNDMDVADISDRLDHFKPEIVLVYGYRQPFCRRAMKWARRNSAHLFMLSDMENRSATTLMRRFAKRVVLPRLLRQLRLVLTVGDANEQSYRTYGVDDQRFVRCCFPIDRSLFGNRAGRSAEDKRLARARLKLPDNQKIILSVGKLVPWKRAQDLIEFSNSLQGHRDDVTVILVGTGTDERGLRRLCRREGPGGVVFAGFVQPKQLTDYYYAADLYAQCSSRDRHPLTVSEAIYAGLPVIVSDRCGSYGPTDDVQPGVNGFVYSCGDVSGLSRLIINVIDQEDLLARLSLESTVIGTRHQELSHGNGLVRALNVISSVKLADGVPGRNLMGTSETVVR